jgi:hypothetical protein
VPLSSVTIKMGNLLQKVKICCGGLDIRIRGRAGGLMDPLLFCPTYIQVDTCNPKSWLFYTLEALYMFSFRLFTV